MKGTRLSFGVGLREFIALLLPISLLSGSLLILSNPTSSAQSFIIGDSSPRNIYYVNAPAQVLISPSLSGDMPVLAISSDGSRLYTGAKGIWRSDDGGVTWRQIQSKVLLTNRIPV
jgi:hypothetical protein